MFCLVLASYQRLILTADMPKKARYKRRNVSKAMRHNFWCNDPLATRSCSVDLKRIFSAYELKNKIP